MVSIKTCKNHTKQQIGNNKILVLIIFQWVKLIEQIGGQQDLTIFVKKCALL